MFVICRTTGLPDERNEIQSGNVFFYSDNGWKQLWKDNRVWCRGHCRIAGENASGGRENEYLHHSKLHTTNLVSILGNFFFQLCLVNEPCARDILNVSALNAYEYTFCYFEGLTKLGLAYCILRWSTEGLSGATEEVVNKIVTESGIKRAVDTFQPYESLEPCDLCIP